MAYLKIESEAKAEEISRNMARIMSPPNTTATHLFGWGTDHNGQSYMHIPMDRECPVYVHENFDDVVTTIAELLGIPAEGRTPLREYLQGGKVVLGNLMPNTLEEFEPYFAPAPETFL